MKSSARAIAGAMRRWRCSLGSRHRLLSAYRRVRAAGQAPGTPAISFTRTVYPIFEAAQCRGCHADDGVASATRLHFPDPNASPDEIDAFGITLAALVNRTDPSRSLLILKADQSRAAHRRRSHPARLLRGRRRSPIGCSTCRRFQSRRWQPRGTVWRPPRPRRHPRSCCGA